ncbi:hypothetical protein EBAPG3_15050 [Nitrosospira lacus]|uniref:Uncharacterized protein n=1 Tax=Nitrosospira lacus TaxID=1288494 RepID=A0A1W6SR25_9PROT|nr:hypothetical protein EBAPG3_15050 [Nitrosospira lacus]
MDGRGAWKYSVFIDCLWKSVKKQAGIFAIYDFCHRSLKVSHAIQELVQPVQAIFELCQENT